MSKQEEQRHILSLIVDNEPGVLARIAGLFSGRGFNIESLCVAETIDPKVSRITLVTRGNMAIIEQIKKQLNKLINVIKVRDFTGTPCVQRELLLIRVKAEPDKRAEILRMVDIFRARVVDVGSSSYTIEVTGDEGKVTAFLNLLRPMGIQEVARTGAIAMARDSSKEVKNGKH
ncbi:MAG: acetolactate synthase small subunit [Deltaproteobacteria bacterium]|nr:acetolactate synthase small subunit [Deltaproteobacteria bacterium]MBW1928188.1 acetolactate synthase small subunit [Deltaproteobacteria bacterium]MBW2025431.1 acetolactate synthase small subunit [Deltaproteobacteria bacterium]MBW2126406.1 acetolactate synthase small subunit [Deltaproteobacteria bacterium]